MPRPAAPPPTVEVDDELDDLPPMDGDDGEAPSPEADDAELLDDEKDDGEDPLDDKSAEDADADARADARELETGATESGWLADAEDADELDVGNDLALFEGDAEAGGDFEELGVGDEDFGLGAGDEAAGLDAGEEGPADDDEELREEDLPPLDADEEGEMDETELIEPSFGDALEVALPWAARAWKPVGAPLGVGEATAVVCSEKGVVVAALARAPSLVRVDLEGACEPLAALSTKRLVASAGLTAIVTDDGRVRVSQDTGATFVVVDGAGEVDDVALSGGEIWVRTRAGKVTRTADLGMTWDAPLGTARALCLSGDSRRVIALVREPGGATRVADAAGRSEPLPDEVAAQIAVGSRLVLRGPAVASAGEPRGLARTVDGARWAPIDGVGRVTAMVFLDDDGTLLVAALAGEGDASWLVHVDAAGDARIVAEIDAPATEEEGADSGVRALARDDAHGVVWAAGAFGLLAFEIP